MNITDNMVGKTAKNAFVNDMHSTGAHISIDLHN